MDEKITAVLVMEILGKPPEHIKETLSSIIDDMGNQKDVKVISKKIAEPKQIERDGKKQDAYTTFAEVEIETSLHQLMMIMFTVTPSHIDIIQPEELRISNTSLNAFFNELITKLHKYDEIARLIMIERQMIADQLKKGAMKVHMEKVGKKTKNIKKKKR